MFLSSLSVSLALGAFFHQLHQINDLLIFLLVSM